MYYTSKEVYEYISKQTKDPIVEWKTCRISGAEFPIYQSDLDFYAKISPTFANPFAFGTSPGQGSTKFMIPMPTLCPEERQRRRLSFRNERKLYKRKCDFSGRDIISIYSPDKPYKVYDQKIRWSDAWDPMIYGRDFDFSRTFTEQIGEMMKEVPRANVQAISCENCDYTNHSYYNKSCYYVFGAAYNQNCFFSDQIANSRECIDAKVIENCENCYQCIGCSNSTFLISCISCKQCHYSQGLINCENCKYCANCYDLNNKSYCINNQQLSKEDYEKEIEKISTVFGKLEDRFVYQNMKQINSDDCIGNEIYNSNNSLFCFDIYDCNGCKYIRDELEGVDSADCYGTNKTPLSYECLSVVNGHWNLGNLICVACIEVLYSQLMTNCKNCFGCVGLRNKSCCIFNKQYTKEEYEKTVSNIIAHMVETGEWGEFFHPSLSPFGYNETVANEYMPLERGKDEKKEGGKGLFVSSFLHLDYSEFGYARSDYSSDPKIPAGSNVVHLKEEQYQERLELTKTDEVLKQVIICEVSSRPFMIQKAELAFYRKHNLSIPSKHPDVRHEERMKLRPGRTLFLRTCDCCGEEMLSVYEVTSNRNKVTGTNHTPTTVNSGCLLPDTCCQKVYCETCYQKEVYS